MSNEKLVMILLGVMLAVQVLQLINGCMDRIGNMETLRSSKMTIMRNLDMANDEIAKLNEANMRLTNHVKGAKELCSTAFAITTDGIKALPKDWVERCYPEKAEA